MKKYYLLNGKVGIVITRPAGIGVGVMYIAQKHYGQGNVFINLLSYSVVITRKKIRFLSKKKRKTNNEQ